MAEEQSLGQLVREFVATLGEYLKQNAADAVDKALAAPLKRAAQKVLLLALAAGLALTGAIFLGLSAFNLLEGLLGSKSAAYAAASGICLLLGALCAWVVRDDRKPKPRPAKSDGGAGGGEVGKAPEPPE
jgi:hypothetical protein